jgi:conjugal transfer pilus assembly protein TraW
VNPLDHVSLRDELIFFDGRDRRQVSFAKQTMRKLKGAAKPIMVAGEPLNLMRDWKRRVFYDQGGALVRRLGIRQVPAVVTQDGKRLRVDEVLP